MEGRSSSKLTWMADMIKVLEDLSIMLDPELRDLNAWVCKIE